MQEGAWQSVCGYPVKAGHASFTLCQEFGRGRPRSNHFVSLTF